MDYYNIGFSSRSFKVEPTIRDTVNDFSIDESNDEFDEKEDLCPYIYLTCAII